MSIPSLFNNYEDVNITNVRELLRLPDIHVDMTFLIGDYGPSATFLFAAVLNKDYKLIDYLIRQNANLNSVCECGTALFAAIQDFQTFKKLHQLGADINITRPGGDSLLIIALYMRQLDVAQYVLEHGINVNTTYSFTNFHSLILASRRGNKKIVQLILDNNVDINVTSLKGDTPLSEAMRKKNTEVAKLLISQGANVNYTLNQYGYRTIMHDALQCDPADEILPYLLSLDEPMTDVNIIDDKGSTLLHYCLRFQSLKTHIYNDLLDAGIDINVENLNGQLAVELKFENNPGITIIKRHIVKLISAGLTVCKRNRLAIESIFEELSEVCLEELMKMKTRRVGASNISYFGVLIMDIHHLVICLKFAGLDQVVDREKLKHEYPMYGGMLFFKLSKINRRIIL